MSTPLMPLTHIYQLAHTYRMAEVNSERVITPMPKSLVEAIDDYRFAERVASRAEAIRRLIEIGLEAAAKVRTEAAASR